jgi:hypothetical protein
MSGSLINIGSALAGSSAVQSLISSTGLSNILPSGLSSILMRGQRKIATIIPDVTIEENHADRVTVTQHPIADGMPVSDHVFRQPSTVTMRCGWSNGGSGMFCALGSAASTGISALTSGASIGSALGSAGSDLMSSFTEQRVNNIYDSLRKLQFDDKAWSSGQVPVNTFKLVTGKRTYDAVVITEISIRTDRTSEYSLMVEAHFQEVMKVKTKSTTQPAQTDQSNPSKTGSPSDNGTKSATPETNPNSWGLTISNIARGVAPSTPRQ